MFKASIALLPVLVGGSVFFAGAWTGYPVPTPRVAQTPFVPRAFALEADFAGADAQQLLKRAIVNLAADRVIWLKTKIRQTVTDKDSTFIATGSLQRGPNGCARLELQVQTADVPSCLLVVSDGEVLAEERRVRHAAPVIVCEHIPGPNDAEQPGGRDAYLVHKGCGGPLAVLRELQAGLHHLQHRTGLVEKCPVLEIKGDMAATAAPSPSFVATVVPVREARIYLDAKDLWPRCIELWGLDKSASACRLVRFEFRDAVINQELPLEECVRTFSYQPEETPR